jgi:hypothetical protein
MAKHFLIARLTFDACNRHAYAFMPEQGHLAELHAKALKHGACASESAIAQTLDGKATSYGMMAWQA